ncbi:MAG: FtsW/RodA/SpoVE family cell cycle protein [Dorea sp.]|nr:FtsW/RodA/SpoVE family cell cycle protein [Dorea sp.]
MANIIIQLSKYLMILLITAYVFFCFSIFGFRDPDRKRRMLWKQTVLMFLIHALAFVSMYLATDDIKMLAFYLMQVSLFAAVLLLYTIIYPKVSRLVVNNMCMLLCIGMIMLTRLDYASAVKQFAIATAAIIMSLFVPVIIRKFKLLSEWRKFYAIAGIASLAVVLVFGQVAGGALLGFKINGISIQPSELVKIIFVFFAASSFKMSLELKNIVITTAIAAFHVLILVVSRDLGAALIIFVVYLVMLYVATRQPLYIAAGLGAGSLASVMAYHLFGHVRVRVVAWQDPLAAYDNGGFQIVQFLFAIGSGGWFGMGLFQGAPETIPVATSDGIFAAISEEMGLIFALCMILICLSCYVMFLNIAMQLHDMFYKLVALGLGTCYIFQVFLTIGGETKFIPLTGVTIPLVSYGGSSLISTVVMFGIIQGLYILREDEEQAIERQRQEKLRAKRGYKEAGTARRKAPDDEKRPQRGKPRRQAKSEERARSKQRIR